MAGRTLRITGGVYRGRRVSCPPGVIRPAMDRMRESMFAILGDLTGLSFLDLFSGSGVVGIEAASRGAAPVVLVERDRRKGPTMKKNTAFVETRIEQRMLPVDVFFRHQARDKAPPFDTVYLDPPFNTENKQGLIASGVSASVLDPAGRLLIHTPREDVLPDTIAGLELYDQRLYGRSVLSFYRWS